MDDLGRTALHVAAALRRQQPEMQDCEVGISDKQRSVEMLLAAGSDPFVRNNSGQRPKEVALGTLRLVCCHGAVCGNGGEDTMSG